MLFDKGYTICGTFTFPICRGPRGTFFFLYLQSGQNKEEELWLVTDGRQGCGWWRRRKRWWLVVEEVVTGGSGGYSRDVDGRCRR